MSANCKGCDGRWGGNRTAPVGSFAANPFGLHDLNGNVFELTADCWNKSHKGAPDDGKVRTDGTCTRRVIKGGSWFTPSKWIRSAARMSDPVGYSNSNVGFRVVRSVESDMRLARAKPQDPDRPLLHLTAGTGAEGPCKDGLKWRKVDQAAGQSAARLESCGMQSPTLPIEFSCSAGRNTVAVAVPMVQSMPRMLRGPFPVSLYAQGQRMQTADGRDIPDQIRQFQAMRQDGPGKEGRLVFEIGEGDPLLQALALGREGYVNITGQTLSFHLDGAREALTAMRSACGLPALNIARSRDRAAASTEESRSNLNRINLAENFAVSSQGASTCRQWDRAEFNKLANVRVNVTNNPQITLGETMRLDWENLRGLMDPKRGTFLTIDLPKTAEISGEGFEVYGRSDNGSNTFPFAPPSNDLKRITIPLGYSRLSEPLWKGQVIIRPNSTGTFKLSIGVSASATYKFTAGIECAGVALAKPQDIAFQVDPPAERFSSAQACHLVGATASDVVNVKLSRHESKIGQPVSLSWSITKQLKPNCTTPLYVMAAFPEEVRFRGDGFVALMPGAAAPFGIKAKIDKLRVFIPLTDPDASLSGSLEILPFRAGRLTLELSLVEIPSFVDRPARRADYDGTTPTVSELSRSAIQVAAGQPEIVVQNRQDLLEPKRITITRNGRWQLKIFDEFYQVFETGTNALVLQKDGRSPAFSQTGRFVSALAKNGEVLEIFDLVAGQLFIRFSGGTYTSGTIGPVAWGENDTFVYYGGLTGFGRVTNTLIDRRDYPISGSVWKNFPTSSVRGVVDVDNLVLISDNSIEPDQPLIVSLLKAGDLNYAGGAQNEVGLARVPIRLKAFDHDEYRISLGGTTRFIPYGHPEPGPTEEYLRGMEKEAVPNWSRSQVRDWLNELRVSHEKSISEYTKFSRLILRHQEAQSPASGRFIVSQQSGGVSQRSNRAVHIRSGITGGARSYSSRRVAEMASLLLNLKTVELAERFAHAGRVVPARYGPDEGKPVEVEPRLARALHQHVNSRAYISALNRMMKEIGGDPVTRHANLTDVHEGHACEHYAVERGKHVVPSRILSRTRFRIDDSDFWLLRQDCMGGSGWTDIQLGLLVQQGNSIPQFFDLISEPREDMFGLNSRKPVRGFMTKDEVLMVALPNRAILLFDVRKGRQLAYLTDVDGSEITADLRLSEDRSRLIKTDEDGKVAIYDTRTGRPILQGVSHDDELVLYTPDGFYAATPEGAHYVYMKFPGVPGLHSFHQFSKRLSRPEVVQAAVRGIMQSSAPDVPVPPSLIAEFSSDNSHIVGSVRASGTGDEHQVRVYQDGTHTNTLSTTGNGVATEFNVARLRGTRWVSLVAVDGSGIASQPVGLDLGPDPRGKARIVSLVVGISDYLDDSVLKDLAGANTDAATIHQTLRKLHPDSAEADHVGLVDARATREAVLREIKAAAAKVGAGDTLLLSFAGHGVKGQDGVYYLTTHDTRYADLANTAIAWGEVSNLLRRSKARIVLLLDACHSGTAGTDFFAANDAATDEILAGVPSNIIIFAASKGREFSYATADGQNGEFTRAFVDVILGQRAAHDLNKNGVIEISELFVGVKRKVVIDGKPAREAEAKRANLNVVGTQTPWIARNQMVGDFALF